MPHCGIHVRISTNCSPAMPSRNPLTMPSDAANVASDASSPTPLIAPVALFGKKTRRTAAAIGSQRVMLRTLFMLLCGTGSQPVRGRDTGRPVGQPPDGLRTRPTSSCEHPYEDDHPHEEH